MTGIPPIRATTVGIPHAAAALRNLERRQEIVANNLANASTTGFKGELPFARLLDNEGLSVVDAATDRSQGAITRTDNPYDVAMAGDGFFVVRTDKGEQLTRGGSWHRDTDGLLVDTLGAPLLGEADPRGGSAGPIRIPDDARNVRIETDGAVVADGTQVGRLRVETVPNDVRLEHAGDGRFIAPAQRQQAAPSARHVQQGALEESNVTPVTSLVSLIEIQRAYSAAQRAITTIDGAVGIVASDLAKP